MKNKSVLVLGAAIALLSTPSTTHAAAPAYKADKSFGAEEIKSAPVCISVDAKDLLYVLLSDGTVVSYDADAKPAGSFKSAMTPPPETMTVTDGKIYLFNTVKVEKEVEYRGKKIKRLIPGGIGCSVYDPAGTKMADIKLPEAQSAADAHFIGKELAVADLAKQQILCYELNGTEGKVTRRITKVFRLCCGIFDFCPGTTPDSLMVANLGAFKVQTFVAGEKTTEFGKRGKEPDEFHGCCNPVNVGTLADGSIITVEKSPTRVKIFDKEGKSSASITGLAELVQGCSTIPIAVDSKGSIYLASDEKKCIVKCVPGVSEKPEPPEPKEQAEPAMPEMSAAMKQFMEKVVPLLEANDYAKANTEAEAVIKANPKMTDDEKAQMMLGVTVSPHVDKGDAIAANKAVDGVLAAYPNSALSKQADSIKNSIKQHIEIMQKAKADGEDEDEDEDGEAPAKPEEK